MHYPEMYGAEEHRRALDAMLVDMFAGERLEEQIAHPAPKPEPSLRFVGAISGDGLIATPVRSAEAAMPELRLTTAGR